MGFRLNKDLACCCCCSQSNIVMESLVGTWKMVSSDNFDEYMKSVGVNLALRKIGATVKPVLTITVAGAGLKMKSVSTFKTIEMDIKLNEDTEEKTPDGRTVKSKYTMDGAKLVQVQEWGGRKTTIVRYVEGGNLNIEMELDGITCKRVYGKAQSSSKRSRHCNSRIF